jgi:energy-converting hydrogenase B subunit Q
MASASGSVSPATNRPDRRLAQPEVSIHFRNCFWRERKSNSVRYLTASHLHPSALLFTIPRPLYTREHAMSNENIGLVIHADAGLGVLHELTGVIARHKGDITSVEIIDQGPREARIYFEIALPAGAHELAHQLATDLRALPIVRQAEIVQTLQKIYGKRIIIMGGGAQVGQVAIGAVSEADRHNIRGEHISVDTIPLVGEQALADAVRAVARLPRAKALVLAGSLMGGEIEQAVREVRQAGLLVISLNMAGSVPAAADLVVSDPVQAGVMAVMAVADTASFNVERLKRRVF